MLSLPASVRIFLCREPVDFRKAHDGLAAMVRSQLAGDPLDGSLFVFLNKRADRIKLLQWDGNGLCVKARLVRSTSGSAKLVHPGAVRKVG